MFMGGVAEPVFVAEMVKDLVVSLEGAEVPAGAAAFLLVVVVAFVGFVARDEYKVARRDSRLSVSRAAARALRKTLDAFVLCK